MANHWGPPFIAIAIAAIGHAIIGIVLLEVMPNASDSVATAPPGPSPPPSSGPTSATACCIPSVCDPTLIDRAITSFQAPFCSPLATMTPAQSPACRNATQTISLQCGIVPAPVGNAPSVCSAAASFGTTAAGGPSPPAADSGLNYHLIKAAGALCIVTGTLSALLFFGSAAQVKSGSSLGEGYCLMLLVPVTGLLVGLLVVPTIVVCGIAASQLFSAADAYQNYVANAADNAGAATTPPSPTLTPTYAVVSLLGQASYGGVQCSIPASIYPVSVMWSLGQRTAAPWIASAAPVLVSTSAKTLAVLGAVWPLVALLAGGVAFCVAT